MVSEVLAGIGIYTVAVSAGVLLLGWPLSVGVLVGGCIMFFNFLWVASLVRKLLEGPVKKSFGLKFAGKQLLLFTVVGVLVALELVDVIGLLMGLSGLFVSVLVCAVKWQFRYTRGGD